MAPPSDVARPPVRFAIIGAGAVSDYHHVPAIRLDPRAALVAACDTDPALLERRRAEWGIDHVTTDAEALCADPGVDAVIVATPNFTHRPIAAAAARHGKHILCEKPLTPTAPVARELVDYCRARGVTLMDGFMWPHHPRTAQVRGLLDAGAIGPVQQVRGAFGDLERKAKAVLATAVQRNLRVVLGNLGVERHHAGGHVRRVAHDDVETTLELR